MDQTCAISFAGKRFDLMRLLISTGLQPGVGATEIVSRFNGLSTVCFARTGKRLKPFTVSLPVVTRLKPSANETRLEFQESEPRRGAHTCCRQVRHLRSAP